jgi:hypothetical protein
MKKLIVILFCVVSLNAADFSAGLLVGYNGGSGFEMNGRVGQFARELPLELQLDINYTGLNPGNAAEVRRIFINNATNGDPEKSGHFWDFRFSFLYKVKLLNLTQTYILLGPRYAVFTGNFKFIGGNEDFDIINKQWGLGTGIISFFPMGSKTNFVLTGGFDYYFPGNFSGHDTMYRADDEHVNPREDFSYDDADAAIKQPKFKLRFLMGISYHLN